MKHTDTDAEDRWARDLWIDREVAALVRGEHDLYWLHSDYEQTLLDELEKEEHLALRERVARRVVEAREARIKSERAEAAAERMVEVRWL